ncbi:hypothetical protein ScPMuIL_013513 [Solemya velum]
MAVVSEEELSEEFEGFGITLSDPNITDKLQELCGLHRLDAGDLVTEWVAYSNTKKNLGLTLEALDHFEREKLSKRIPKTPKTPKLKKQNGPVIYDINNIEDGMDEDGAEALYNAYSTPSSKGQGQKKRQLTPDNLPLKRFTGPNRSPVIPFSPASFSPSSATPSKKFSSRTNAGEVLNTFGKLENINWSGSNQVCAITSYDLPTCLEKRIKYMFQKLTDKAQVLNDLIEDIGMELKAAYEIEEYSHIGLPVQDQVTVVGRICCDCNGKLNAKSVLLEGSRETSAGKSIPLDLTDLTEFSLFPGQVSAFDGTNATGMKFVAKKVYPGICLPLPEIKVKPETDITKLSVMIAAGPFTTSDNLAYEPLTELIKYIQRDKPDVCVLMGPFVDSRNEEIDKGHLGKTYEELFRTQMEIIARMTEKVQCKVLIVPSQRDVHHDFVYPQPPFVLKDFNNKHIQFVSDPATICINNVVFGLTSTDVLFHLGQEEISFPPGGTDRLGRLTQHLLTQHSYYPLYPQTEDMNVDHTLQELYGHMPVTPHVLVVPSDLRYFIKDIKGCFCVNPGRLAKGQVGGTYTRMVINTQDIASNSSLVPNISAQVLRV